MITKSSDLVLQSGRFPRYSGEKEAVQEEGAMMDRLMPLIIILPVLALIFWLWMVWDMSNNDNLPESVKFNWLLAFLFLSLFAAVFYYVTEYRKK